MGPGMRQRIPPAPIIGFDAVATRGLPSIRDGSVKCGAKCETNHVLHLVTDRK